MWWAFGAVAGIGRAIVGLASISCKNSPRTPTIPRANDALTVEDVLAASGGMQGLKDVLPTVVQDALQELMDAEVTPRLEAGRWEGTRERSGMRIGSRLQTVSTPAGDVEVKCPSPAKGCSPRTCLSCVEGSTAPCGV